MDTTTNVQLLMENQSLENEVREPEHYLANGYECRTFISSLLTTEQLIGYYWGNIIKYIWRWPKKGGRKDLMKAKQYIEFLLEVINE